jgi:penicillin-binding protein 1B
VLVTTLSLADQEKAEAAVAEGVAEVAARWEGKEEGKSLQAALVSVDPADGAILAYVGGRDYATSQFDRVSMARRQPGSAFKPVVYAAALAEHAATPASMLDDVPFEVFVEKKLWSPKNSDGLYHGRVSVRHALERSLNVPTARLALQTGLGPVIDLAHGMGIRGRIAPFPALALGTMEATPLEMATVYTTLAAGGIRPSLHAVEAVYDRQGKRVDGRDLPPPERVVDPDVAFLITHALRGVLDRGTGASARRQGVHDPVAGKTGTSNDRRDSWFAGYSPERTTLVWVGYDDNSTTRLSGSRAALPIWARFTKAVRPPDGFRSFAATDGVVGAWVDPETGGLATSRCPEIAEEFFLRDFPPGELCPLHDGWRARPLPQPDGIEVEPPRKKRHRFQDWLEMVRGQRGRD